MTHTQPEAPARRVPDLIEAAKATVLFLAGQDGDNAWMSYFWEFTDGRENYTAVVSRTLAAAIAAERERREAVEKMADELERAVAIIRKAAAGYGHYVPNMRAALARYREATR